MTAADTPTPELQTMTLGQYDLVEFGLVAAGFALFAHFLHSWVSRDEVGAQSPPGEHVDERHLVRLEARA